MFAKPEIVDTTGRVYTTASLEYFFKLAQSNRELFTMKILQELKPIKLFGKPILWVRTDKVKVFRDGLLNTRIYKPMNPNG